MKIGVEYLRYSSEKQTEQSIEGQMRICDEYAQRNNIMIVDRFIDRATTGTNDNRKSFQRMLKMSGKKEWDVVLVYKFDRFSRNKYETAIHKKTLKDNGVKLISATENIPDTPEGIILESMLEGMAEYYSAELSQKVKRGMRETIEKGNYTGGTYPYGYKIVDHKYVVNEDEAKIVNRVFQEYAAGKSVKEYMDQLNASGIKPHKGNKFTANHLYYILRNKKYTGVSTYGGKTYYDTYPRIISDALFESVQKRIVENRYGKHGDCDRFILRNILYCGLCGRHIIGESGTSQCGKVIKYYKCSGRKKMKVCKKETIHKTFLEDLIISTTKKLIDSPERIDLLVDKIYKKRQADKADCSLLNILEGDLKKVNASISNIMKAIEEGILTPTTKQRLNELETETQSLKDKIAAEKNKPKLFQDDVKKLKSDLTKLFKKEPSIIINSLIEKIILYEDRVEIFYKYTNLKNPDPSDRDFDFKKNILLKDFYLEVNAEKTTE